MELYTSLKIIFFYLSLLWIILFLNYSLNYEKYKSDNEKFKLKKIIINPKNQFISGFMESENYKCLYFIKELNDMETKSIILSIGLDVFSENYIELFKNNLFIHKK